MGVCRPGAFVDLDGGPCGLWGRLARYGACNCRSGVPPPDSAAGMVSPYWAARCAVGEFAGGHEPPGRSPRRRGGGRSTPNGMLQRTLMGVLMGPANRPGLDAADRRHPGMGGPDLRTPVGVLAALLGCYVAGGNGRRRESGLRATPARGGGGKAWRAAAGSGGGRRCRRSAARFCGAAPLGGTVLWRGGMPPGRIVPPGTVPPIGGTVYGAVPLGGTVLWRHGFARRQKQEGRGAVWVRWNAPSTNRLRRAGQLRTTSLRGGIGGGSTGRGSCHERPQLRNSPHLR